MHWTGSTYLGSAEVGSDRKRRGKKRHRRLTEASYESPKHERVGSRRAYLGCLLESLLWGARPRDNPSTLRGLKGRRGKRTMRFGTLLSLGTFSLVDQPGGLRRSICRPTHR